MSSHLFRASAVDLISCANQAMAHTGSRCPPALCLCGAVRWLCCVFCSCSIFCILYSAIEMVSIDTESSQQLYHALLFHSFLTDSWLDRALSWFKRFLSEIIEFLKAAICVKCRWQAYVSQRQAMLQLAIQQQLFLLIMYL
ncbi:hypothetical protein CEXT_39451 [Caerostris extrusa]|uniref:Uncharacterized protein n=1 Tax=Caerostris extrusa TaxID=172846 RepID=A0AAV4PCD3_CAEEX|nr:hypothetical protein CEXT_39451 [Caerostris extrusa]